METKISIVTPVYNGEKYIEKCILSIANQNYSNYEHIIVDGGSTDGTLAIVKKYSEKYPIKWVSEKDNGMYEAICRGFKMASGDIFAWLNSDDIYMPWTFQVVNRIMKDGVEWCTGVNALQDANGILYAVRNARYYKQKWLKKGYYGKILPQVVQQESTFWTRTLWEKSGAESISSFRYAGDWKLWCLFAEHEPLYTVTTVIACFRKHEAQLSSDFDKYRDEMGLEKESRVFRVWLRIRAYIYSYILPLLYDRNSKYAKSRFKRIDLGPKE